MAPNEKHTIRDRRFIDSSATTQRIPEKWWKSKQKKNDLRIINRKIRKLFKETELNLEEIVKLKYEKQNILNIYLFTRSEIHIQTKLDKLYDELEDWENNNCAYEP